jgi:hypothetical protein
MFQFSPRSEKEDIKALVFMYRSTQQLRDGHIKDEQFELAAEAQEQMRVIKQTLFQILLADRFMLEQAEDASIIIKAFY